LCVSATTGRQESRDGINSAANGGGVVLIKIEIHSETRVIIAANNCHHPCARRVADVDKPRAVHATPVVSTPVDDSRLSRKAFALSSLFVSSVRWYSHAPHVTTCKTKVLTHMRPTFLPAIQQHQKQQQQQQPKQ
jgi:hypothetical protein